MTNAQAQREQVGIAAALKSHFQLAYVVADIDQASAKVQATLDLGEFEAEETSFDIIDDEENKVDELTVKAVFALGRAFELIQPISDPLELFRSHAGQEDAALRFHHVGAYVSDLAPAVAEAQDKELPVMRLRRPMLDIAFVDLTALSGHRLELLCPQGE